MPGPAKLRGPTRQSELDLRKLEESLEDIPDEVTLGKLQSALEVLLSERSHPMVVELSKQLERLRNAETLIEREGEVRGRLHRESSENALAVKGRAAAADPVQNAAEADAESDQRNASDSSSSAESIDDDAEEDPLDERDSKRGSHQGAPSSKNATFEKPPMQNAPSGSDSDSVNLKRKRESSDSADEEDENEAVESQSALAAATDLSLNEEHRAGAGKGVPGSQMHVEEGDKTENADASSELGAGNSKFVPNPKSEFVPTQALPTHTLGLFNENDDDESEEAYKRKLGVVSYPKEDLSTLVAGPVPTEDYTRAKPANQVQWSTYATFLEPYFRPFAEEDIQLLQQPTVGGGMEAANLRGGRKLSAYTVPPLGPWYRQQWAQQDAEIAGTDVMQATKKAIAAEPHTQAVELSKTYQPLGRLQDISEQTLELPNNVSLGPFTERLLSALMPEMKENDAGDTESEPDNAVSAIPMPTTMTPAIDDFAHLEERVKGEFRYVGVLDMGLLRKFEHSKSQYKLALSQHHDEFSDPLSTEVDWVNGSEDDEICRELRVLQHKLKDVSHRNAQYKERLLPLVQEQMAWQEYSSILQDLDKQVDQAYAKRLKAPKVTPPKPKKKKSGSAVDSPASFSAAESPGRALEPTKLPDHKPAVKALLNKRERWIQKIGPLFKKQYLMMRLHESPKFEGLVDADDEEDENEDREDKFQFA